MAVNSVRINQLLRNDCNTEIYIYYFIRSLVLFDGDVMIFSFFFPSIF